MQTIQELAMSVTTEMTAAGYAQSTTWQLYLYAILPLVRLHEARGKAHFDADLTAEHIGELKNRYYSGDISRVHYYHRVGGIDKITRLHETGKLLWETPRKGSMYKINDYYEGLLNEYLASDVFHPNTRGDVVWVSRSFFAWLIDNACADLSCVTAAEIQKYVVHCSGLMTSASIYNVLLYVRKLCAYLFERGLLTNSFSALLRMNVSRESKMYPAARQDEIAVVLGQIDRSTVRGKRDHALILLGVVTGLRAVDIKNLKLSDIDWLRGEIRIVQSKTGNTNVLPLTTDVGEALKDYILHARPNSVDDNVFIRLHPPLIAVKDAWSIGDIWDRYRKRAGLSREAFDGKGFHSLRRALGKNMITAGVPVEAAAQTMGDEKIDSMKKYIALDSEHLGEVALDFTGIEVSGGATR
jgi:integrase